ncbi:MAG: L-lysine dehydrogenase, partial [Gammaproteobacteria bacterium]
MSFEKIAVLGLGKVGKLAAKLLHDSGFAVTGYDVRTPREKLPFAVENTDLNSPEALAAELTQVEAVLSCLPYHLNVAVATAAHAAGIHYFDLTEDVPT